MLERAYNKGRGGTEDEVRRSEKKAKGVPAVDRNEDRGVRQVDGGVREGVRRGRARTRENRQSSRAEGGVVDVRRQTVLHLVLSAALPNAGSAGLFVWHQSRAGQPLDSPPDPGGQESLGGRKGTPGANSGGHQGIDASLSRRGV